MSGFLLIIYSKITGSYTLYLILFFRYVMQHGELYSFLKKQTTFKFNLIIMHNTRQVPSSPLDSRLLEEKKSEQAK